jgi:hypothetical protein
MKIAPVDHVCLYACVGGGGGVTGSLILAGGRDRSGTQRANGDHTGKPTTKGLHAFFGCTLNYIYSCGIIIFEIIKTRILCKFADVLAITLYSTVIIK